MEKDLVEIKNMIEYIENAPVDQITEKAAPVMANLAIARALVAIADRLDKLTGPLSGDDPKAKATRAFVVSNLRD